MKALTTLALTAFAAILPAQMSGTYTVDPGGSGARNYKSIGAVIIDLFQQGVSAPVVVEIAAGVFAEQLLVPAFPGGSRTNTVTFRGAAQGKTSLKMPKNATDLLEFQSVNQWPEGIRFERISFEGNGADRGYVRMVGDALQLVECSFDRTEVYLYGVDLLVRDCRLTNLHRNMRIYCRGGGRIFRNYFHATHNQNFIWIYGSWGTPQALRIYNNVFVGNDTQPIRLEDGVEFTHNTVYRPAGSSSSRDLLWIYTSFYDHPVVTNNILADAAGGRQMTRVFGQISPLHLTLDNNLYDAGSSSAVFADASGKYYDLLAWRFYSGVDAQSLDASAGFTAPTSLPTGLKLDTTSPAIGAAVGTPAYVTDDFEGAPRNSPATLGAFRGPRISTWVPYGQGCPGSGNIVPEIGFTGTLALGSNDFTVTLQKALGGFTVQALMALGVQKIQANLGGTCNLLVNPLVILQTNSAGSGAGTGSAQFKLPIPNNPSLIGKQLHFQWAVTDPAAAGAKLATTRAATLAF